MRGPRERGAERIKELNGALGSSARGRHHATPTDIPKVWNGLAVTEKEKLSLLALHSKRTGTPRSIGVSPWLQTASSTELLRFLRNKSGNVDDAWKTIVAHARWRVSKHGADTIVRENAFEHSVLNREVFWLGLSKSDCPTLVIRTKAHDGADYNEDPKVFTRCACTILCLGVLLPVQLRGMNNPSHVEVEADSPNPRRFVFPGRVMCDV